MALKSPSRRICFSVDKLLISSCNIVKVSLLIYGEPSGGINTIHIFMLDLLLDKTGSLRSNHNA